MRTKNSLNRLSSSSSVSSALSRSQDSAASLSFVSNASIDSSTDQLSASSSASSNCSSGDSGIVSRKGMSSSKSSIELVDKQNNSVKNAHSTSQRFSFFENNKNIFAGHKKEQSLGSRIVSVPLNNLKKSGCRVKEHLLSVTRPAKALSYQKSDLTNGNIDTATIESKFRREVHITNNNPDFTKENPYAYCRPATTKLTNNILLTSGNTPMTSSFSSAIFNFGVKTDIRQHDSIKRTIIHASTGEILKGIASLINYKCSCLRHFDTDQLTIWLRTVDRSLLVQGWQDIAFLNPANMVFFFMLVRSVLNEEEDFPIKNIGDLQSVVLTCLYVSYSYMGNEIKSIMRMWRMIRLYLSRRGNPDIPAPTFAELLDKLNMNTSKFLNGSVGYANDGF
uniref:Cyclin-dependent kinase 5 activator 1-like n=1 Tax=Rhabditophanes sp. KR3021 TaxID=114890 RepID=A0AC35UDI7_9BILA